MEDSTIPPPSNEMIETWVSQIISTHNLSITSSIKEIAELLISFFENQFTNYNVSLDSLDSRRVKFHVINQEQLQSKESSNDFMDAIFDSPFDEPMTPEAEMIAQYIEKTLDHLLEKLDIVKPEDYESTLKQIGFSRLEKIPKYREQAFTFWAEKLINYFKFTTTTDLNFIIIRTQLFFDMLLSKYQITYRQLKDRNKFPMIIDRIDDDSLFWASEIENIRCLIYCTYYNILHKLKRLSDYPKDPNFWFRLALIYEKVGNSSKAQEFGQHGLDLDPDDFSMLMELVIYYAENQQHQKGFKYLKKAGEIYIQKEMFQPAINIWKQIVNFEPNRKENWLNLAKVYDKLNNKEEAERCRVKASQLT